MGEVYELIFYLVDFCDRHGHLLIRIGLLNRGGVFLGAITIHLFEGETNRTLRKACDSGSSSIKDRSGSFVKQNEPNTSRNLSSFKKRADPELVATRLS